MKCPKCDSPMTLFGSKIFDGAMICNECYEKLSSKQQEGHSVTSMPYSSVPAQSQTRQRATTAMGIGRREPEEVHDNIMTQQVQPEPLQQISGKTGTTAGTARKKPKGEELTPLTPGKIGGLIKAQKMREQQELPVSKAQTQEFTPLSPDQFIGLFKGPKREEFIEPEEREEDFTPVSPDKFPSYGPPAAGKIRDQKTIEGNLAEAVGKFVSPPRGKMPAMPAMPPEVQEEYMLPQQKRKFPHINILTPRPLTPARPQEQVYQQPQEDEELYQAINMLFQQQETLGNSISELQQKMDYQTQILEEIYRALEQYFSGEY
ncbi:MAG: hypothetical protein ABRQ38_05940 [Candidatus Eremiobacterota bacterium]